MGMGAAVGPDRGPDPDLNQILKEIFGTLDRGSEAADLGRCAGAGRRPHAGPVYRALPI
jgi:hypothetical protein